MTGSGKDGLLKWNDFIRACDPLGVDQYGWGVYRKETDVGYVLIRFHGGSSDVQYQEHDRGELTVPITWVAEDRETVIRRFDREPFAFHIHSHRKYGQPKLRKPDVLKGVSRTFTVKFGNVACQCFVKGDDLWIRHRDFFSPVWNPPPGEQAHMPQNYYLEKYFGKRRLGRFIYEDNYGAIVLRSEAWLHFERVLPIARHARCVFTRILLERLAAAIHREYPDIEILWGNMFEEIHKNIIGHF